MRTTWMNSSAPGTPLTLPDSTSAALNSGLGSRARTTDPDGAHDLERERGRGIASTEAAVTEVGVEQHEVRAPIPVDVDLQHAHAS